MHCSGVSWKLELQVQSTVKHGRDSFSTFLATVNQAFIAPLFYQRGDRVQSQIFRMECLGERLHKLHLLPVVLR